MIRLLLLALVVACSSRAPGGEAPRPPEAEAAAPSASRVVTERFRSDALGVE
jgi:hypothetical protein